MLPPPSHVTRSRESPHDGAHIATRGRLSSATVWASAGEQPCTWTSTPRQSSNAKPSLATVLNLSSGGCDWAALCTMYIDKPELVNLYFGLHHSSAGRAGAGRLSRQQGVGYKREDLMMMMAYIDT